MKNLKKAISPVVATALLLVVAVVAVVGFQTWFQTYQSGINSKVEQQSNAGSAITIDRLETTGLIYVHNGAVDPISWISTKINSTCNNNSAGSLLGKNITQIQLAGCSLKKDSSYNVVIVTNGGTYSSTLIAR